MRGVIVSARAAWGGAAMGNRIRTKVRRASVVALCALVLASAETARGQAPARDLHVEGPRGALRSEKNLALVIGNSAYSSVGRLRNPVNDARGMARALRELGFEVLAHEDLGDKAMRRAILEFGSRLPKGGVGLFYYAGHGIQANGRNYLIPVDANIGSEAEAEVEAIDVAKVLARMETANTQVNIVILDACRNNPFARSFRSAVNGLAMMDAPSGTLVAYATAPGKVARDGDGTNGLFTSELLKAIQVPGLTIEQVFKRVRQGVSQETRGEQVPWESSSLVGEFVFKAPQAPSGGLALVPPPAETAARERLEEGARSADEAAGRSPEELRRRVEDRLRANGFALEVTLAADGTTTLTGVLESAQGKEQAKSIAAGVPGVRGLRDAIFVAPLANGPRRLR